MKAGSDVVIVSSGAIAAGIEPLRLTKRPTDLATKQAAASVGQVALVNAWSAAFARYNRAVGQVLLTAHDISMRVQHTNAQRTLDPLPALHAAAHTRLGWQFGGRLPRGVGGRADPGRGTGARRCGERPLFAPRRYYRAVGAVLRRRRRRAACTGRNHGGARCGGLRPRR